MVIICFHMVRPESLIKKKVKKKSKKSKQSQKKSTKKFKKIKRNKNVQSSDSGAKESRHIYIYMENTGKEDNNIELNCNKLISQPGQIAAFLLMAYGFQSIKNSIQLSPFPAPSQPQPPTPESQDPCPAPSHCPRVSSAPAQPCPWWPW